MKYFILCLLFLSCSSPSPQNYASRGYKNTYRCTSLLEAYSNDENIEAIRVLLKEGEVELQKETEQGMYLSYADPDRSKAEYMVTFYLADRLNGRYTATLLNCFNKNERKKSRRRKTQK